MSLINLLVSITTIGNFGGVSVKHEWIVNIIKWIIELVGDVGLGIILFTLILKLITLPLDIYSRASTKKNSLKMELMQDDLKKLQKQYKNNSQLYQQKMMALYKKNGYSAFSACLPTIVTLVFFIIVISAFNSYSRFADKEVFNKMGEAYDKSLAVFEDEGVLIKNSQTKNYDLNVGKAIEEMNFTAYFEFEGEDVTKESAYKLKFSTFLSDSTLVDKYSTLKDYLNAEGDGLNQSNLVLTNNINEDCSNYIVNVLTADQKTALENSGYIIKKDGKYSIRDNRALATGEYGLEEYFIAETYAINYAKIIEEDPTIANKFNEDGEKLVSEVSVKVICDEYIEKEIKAAARKASQEAYEEHASRSVIFPWVKNLWVVDSPTKSALPTISELQTSIGAENMGSLKDKNVYNELTYNLSEYKQTGFGKGNGLFILVALSILSMLASTIINNKAQKTQMQLSSVDGENSQAATTQKMMTWIMPIMFGIFAFIYSAAFSIYMITSTLLSTGFTLLINFCVERAFKNKIAQIEAQKQSQRKYGKRRD